MPRAKTGTEKAWKAVFLAALEERPIVKHAARKAGISHITAYEAKYKSEANPKTDNFAVRWEQSMEIGLDQVEEDLLDLGIGVKKGQVAALIYYLKARRYEKRSDSSMPTRITLEWVNYGEI